MFIFFAENCTRKQKTRWIFAFFESRSAWSLSKFWKKTPNVYVCKWKEKKIVNDFGERKRPRKGFLLVSECLVRKISNWKLHKRQRKTFQKWYGCDLLNPYKMYLTWILDKDWETWVNKSQSISYMIWPDHKWQCLPS